ncbi:MAG: PVC-type heme-binding CxxCH protein [Pirellulales bacterium]
MILCRIVLVFAARLLILLATGADAATGPLSPAETLADLQLPAGLRVELVAAEPEVVDPVAIAFDEDGRLWVVEMRDYPTLPEGQAPASRIRVLRDRDGDGRYETATTFADGLLFPTGVQPWRGGVIVTLAGEVAFFPDADRDDRADGKQVWYRGFATNNEQLRANHPTLAIDGRVYVAGGMRGGSIINVRDPEAPAVSINGRDFAFDPDSGVCEAVTGNGQFGMTLDDFGRRFTCSNRNPLIQVMIEQRYLAQNPQLVLPAVVQDVAAAGDASRVYARTRALTTANSHAGQFTAACGVHVFRGDALPDEYRGNAFVCEPTANLVHREIIDSRSAAFSSKPVPTDGEFLASSDEWFRPVNLTTGPDGALYVVDMCRAVIEHPAWMPEELRSRTDLRHGDDRGRIYRIVSDEARASQPIAIDKSPSKLLKLLEHPNAWQRELAARLIRESGTANATELQRLATSSHLAAARSLALQLLQSLKLMDEATLVKALADESPGVREQALVLVEPRLAHSVSFLRLVTEMADDPSPRVRYQVALSLSMVPEAPFTPLAEIALRDVGDMWTSRAVALAARDRATSVLADVFRSVTDDIKASDLRGLISELATAAVVTGDSQQIVDMTIGHIRDLDEPLSRELLRCVAGAVEARGDAFAPLLVTVERKYPESYQAIFRLFDAAVATSTDDAAAQAARVEALRLLRLDQRPATTDAMLRLISHDSTAIQTAAVEALIGRASPQVVDEVLAQLPEQMPAVRRASLDLLLANNESTRTLLEAIESEELAAANIDAARAEQLKKHPDKQIRELAKRVLGARSADRVEVLRQYQSALALVPDRVNGRKIFAAHCAACHRLGGEGTAIGPDIGDSSLRTPAQLLADILQPNLAVDANYVSYAAVIQDGRVFQGVIRTESDSGIVLATAEGKTITLSRDDLESLTSSGTSLMPEGVEQQISPQQMADVIGYIRNWREVAGGAAETGGN